MKRRRLGRAAIGFAGLIALVVVLRLGQQPAAVSRHRAAL